MTMATAAQAATDLDNAGEDGGSAGQSADGVSAFLVAMAKVLHETIARFEETVARITEIAMTRSSRTDRDLVIALQEFDRLQQEFVIFGEVLTRVAATQSAAWAGGAGANQLGHEAIIAAISIAELKGRLLYHLKEKTTDSAPSATSEEMIF
jgi:hypothetical protein